MSSKTNYDSNRPMPKSNLELPDDDTWNPDSEDDESFTWQVDDEKTGELGKKVNAHILQAKGGLIANYFGKLDLSFPKATIFGNRLEWILKDEEPRENSCL